MLQSNRLEQVQKRCLKIIFGYGKTYSNLLEESGLETLSSRRLKALAKFAYKAPKKLNYESSNSTRPSQRSGKIYMEKFARTQRLYDSPLYTMRRILNNSQNDLTNTTLAFDLPHLFNKPYN